MRGPIDFIVVGFEGNKFDGSVLKALGEAIDNGTIGLVSLMVITKDKNGDVKALSIDDVGDDYIVQFAQKYKVSSEQISKDDVDEVADLLENNTSAGILIIEQLWAKPLKKALIDAGGVLVSEGRIHPDAAAELNDKGDN
jgi:hypothetical protein